MARYKSRAAASGKPLGSKKSGLTKGSRKIKLAKASRKVKPSKMARFLTPANAYAFAALPFYAGRPFERYVETYVSGRAYSANNTRNTVFLRGYDSSRSTIQICCLNDQRNPAEQDYPVFLNDTDMDDRNDIPFNEVVFCESSTQIGFQVMLILLHTLSYSHKSAHPVIACPRR